MTAGKDLATASRPEGQHAPAEDRFRDPLVMPASMAQRALWFMQQVDPATDAYHLRFCARVLSEINRTVAKQSLQALVERHSMLRSTFRCDGEQVEMVTREACEASFFEIDATGQSDSELRDAVAQCVVKPFDLANGPLMRVYLFSQNQAEHLFLLVIHELICDPLSLARLLAEFKQLYQAGLGGQSPELLPDALDYPALAIQEQHWLSSPASEASKTYWLERLSGNIPELALPTSHARRSIAGVAAGAAWALEIEEPLWRQIIELARSRGATPRAVLLSAYQTLLMRLSGQSDIIVGVALPRRAEPSLEAVIGPLVNLAPIRVHADADGTFRDVVKAVALALEGAIEHQALPFAELLRVLRPAAGTEQPPLFRTIFNHVTLSAGDPTSVELLDKSQSMEWGPLTLAPFPVEAPQQRFDLAGLAIEINGRVAVQFQYNAQLFDREQIAQFGRCLHQLLVAAVADPDQILGQIPLLSADDRRQMLESWNETSADYPRNAVVHALLSEQAAQTPDRIALVVGERRLSYQQLDRRANQVAHYLHQQGVGRGDLVAVSAERSAELVIALLGVLKCGAAFIPVDPKYPTDRIKLMLQDSGARLVLTTSASDAFIASGTSAQRFCLDSSTKQLDELPEEPLPSISDPLDVAYVIYTSGSTGKPKGVQIPHRALVNFLWAMRTRPGLSPDDVLLSVTTFSFDIFYLELFLPLLVGARLELASVEEVVDGKLLARRLAACGATVMQATPITWRMLLSAGFKPDRPLKALCGGEALPTDLARQLLDAGLALWNMYGPTETTIWSSVELVSATNDRMISIGRPIANTQAYVLDSRLLPLPIGVVGQLYLGGDGLARGYLNRPELTAEKFIASPFDPHGLQRIYNTGDLARYLPDGRLECVGRADQQIKIRGHRVELEEIETVLEKHEEVAQAVVALREDRPGNQYLACYFLKRAAAGSLTGSDLRAWLLSRLPKYMVPAAFVPVAEFPLTPNGKVDRAKLPPPQPADLSAPSASGGSAEPLNDDERLLIEIWKELLGLSQVSPLDNFFEIGGHSLLAVRMFVRIEGYYRRPLPVALLFASPTIRELSHAIEYYPPVVAGPHVFTFRREGTRPPIFLMPSMAGDVLQWREFVAMLGDDRPLCGIYMAGEPDYQKKYSFEAFASQIATAIATAYPGAPCHLFGYSFGGMLAFEVARQLRMMDREVGLVAILDTGLTTPIPGKVRSIVLNAPRILRNLLSRAVNAAQAGQWRKELGGILFKIRLTRRKLGTGRSDMEDEELVAFEYMFGRIDIPEKTRRMMSWSLKMLTAYRPKSYRGNLFLLRASKRPLLGPFEPDLGWGKVVGGQLSIKDFPGSHAQMIEPAQMGTIAGLLTESLEEFDSDVAPGK